MVGSGSLSHTSNKRIHTGEDTAPGHPHIWEHYRERGVALALPVPNRSMLGAASGLGAAAASGAASNKSKTKNTQAFTPLDEPA